jgi:hypothetical protein
MKRSRSCRIFALFALAVILLFALPLVSADEIDPTVTDVFFQKDGLPYNGSVQFTVNCYGYACKSWDCERNPEDLLARQGNYTPELVFSYYASCPGYGCRIFEPYYHAERNFVNYCNLDGTSQGTEFHLLNVSHSAIPQNCTELRQYSRSGGRNSGYFNETPVYAECVNETRRHREECDQYLASCNPLNETECGWRGVKDQYFRETPSYRTCADTVDREQSDCSRFLEKVEPSNMVMWKNEGREEPARRACELRFAIPPDNFVSPASSFPEIAMDPARSMPAGMVFGKPAVATAQRINPVESLYCRIVRFLGGRCD